MHRHSPPLVIDDIQNVLLPSFPLFVLVDQNRDRRGQFVLTGSHQTALGAAVDQSLAGRTSVLYLMQLSFTELEKAAALSIDVLMLRGFLPKLHVTYMDPTRCYRDYMSTHVERDGRNRQALLHIP